MPFLKLSAVDLTFYAAIAFGATSRLMRRTIRVTSVKKEKPLKLFLMGTSGWMCAWPALDYQGLPDSLYRHRRMAPIMVSNKEMEHRQMLGDQRWSWSGTSILKGGFVIRKYLLFVWAPSASVPLSLSVLASPCLLSVCLSPFLFLFLSLSLSVCLLFVSL